MIIGVSGYSGSGKDLVGTMIQFLTSKTDSKVTLDEIIDFPINHEYWLEEKSGWEIKKWAGKLKTIASLLTGIPVEKFEDQKFKKTNLGIEWNQIVRVFGEYYDGHVEDWTDEVRPMSVREFLQKLGTDGLRNGLHSNVWVNALMADYKHTQVQWANGPIGGYEDGELPNWIITDTRFPNEAEAIREKEGIMIRVERPGVKPINNHPSEVSLDDYTFDHVIQNNGSLEDLLKKVKSILQFHKII